MRFSALATDYDGTLADEGVVAPQLIASLERLRASGFKIFLVTGREVEDLTNVFPRCDLFDRVVAENGGVLYDPKQHAITPLHAAPSRKLVERLQARGVSPLSVGHVLIATPEPHEAVHLDNIKHLELAH